MLRIVVEITGEVDDPQGIKEKLAMDLERFGDVRVVSVQRIEPKQMKLKAMQDKTSVMPPWIITGTHYEGYLQRAREVENKAEGDE